MTSEVVARFRIRTRPFVAKAIFSHWRQGYRWGPGCYEGFWTPPVAGGNGGVDKDTVSKVYLLSVTLYKHWLEIILKFNIAYYLITGLLVAIYLTRGLRSLTGFLLVLPLAIGIGAIIYGRNCVAVIKNTEKDVADLKTRLDAKTVQETGYIVDLLEWSSKWFTISVVGLSVLVLVCLIITGIKTDTFRWFFDIFPR
jgi:hypothetical protein